MNAKALAIARELADLLAVRRSIPLHAIPTPPVARDVAHAVLPAFEARPLSREERELAAYQTRLLRQFFQARYYAQMRARSRHGR